MEDQEMNKKILLAQPLGSRKRGSSRLRWRVGTDEDELELFAIWNWWMLAQYRDEWEGFLEEAKINEIRKTIQKYLFYCNLRTFC